MGLNLFLQITDNSVKVLAAPGGAELVEVSFASSPEKVKPPPVAFRFPSEIPRHSTSRTLAGLRFVIEPADIAFGGWQKRSSKTDDR